MTTILKFLFIAMLAFPLWATEDTIVLVADRDSPALNNLYKHLKKQTPNYNYKISTKSSRTEIDSDDFVILVGAKIPKFLQLANHKKTIAVLVTEAQSQKLNVNTSIWIEPPLSRQLKLSNLIIPGERKIGLLVNGSESRELQLSHLTEAQKAMLNVVDLAEFDNINQALFRVLKDTRLLLGTYDNEIYNARNIKNILITSYRQQKVLIGPSRAYLKAGSFATTFSDLDHIAKRVIDVIKHYNSEGEWIKPNYNPYYRILFNQQVARSLNLLIMDRAEIEEKMRED